MNDRGADPGTNTLLSTVKDDVHHTRRLWSALYTIQTLTGVAQPVLRSLCQEVLLSQRPEVEHIYGARQHLDNEV